MTQGKFSKEECEETEKAVEEMFKGLPKTKQPAFIGHLNDILLFLSAAKKKALSEEGEKTLEEIADEEGKKVAEQVEQEEKEKDV